MPSAPVIRPMRAADLPAARRLWAATEGVELAEGDRVAELRRYLRRNPGLSQVAVIGSKLVGAVLAGHDGRRGMIYHLAVDRHHRGAGLGRRLVAQTLSALKHAALTRVLILVARDNRPGLRFWRKQGWEKLTFAQPFGLDL